MTNPETTALPPVSRIQQHLRLWILVCGSLVIVVGGLHYWIDCGLAGGREALESSQFATARSAASRYLWLHPDCSEARWVIANGFAKDNSLDARTAAESAIEHLQRIPDSEPLAARARMLEGRLTFLILLRPGRAEELFHRSIELDPDQFDSHYMLWKLYDMTERYVDSESEFREVWRVAPPEQRPWRLREWFLSQFAPTSACGDLDVMMGFRPPDQPTGEIVVLARLKAFYEEDPESPVAVAAYAYWHLRNMQRETALEILDGISDRVDAINNPFFAMTLCEVLADLGQLDRADELFSRFPVLTTSYVYCRIAGILQHEGRQDYAEAIKWYELACANWPGPADWMLMNRLQRCLALTGDLDRADAMREQAGRIEELMSAEHHQHLREALQNLDDPIALGEMVEFYASLDRPWEVESWQTVIDDLQVHRMSDNNPQR